MRKERANEGGAATHGPRTGMYSTPENIRQIPRETRLQGGRTTSPARHYLDRAHSVGAERQLYDQIALARLENAIALHLHRQRQAATVAEAA